MTQITNYKQYDFRIFSGSLFRISNLGFRSSLVFSISCLGFILLPQAVNAGVIVQRPLYIGLTNGLVGYWSFDAPDMAGVAAYDRSGNNNTGTLTNGPTRQIGKIGQALNFDGVNDYVLIPADSSLNNFTNEVTVSAWVYSKTTLTDTAAILESTTNNNLNTRFLLFQFTDGKLYWRVVRGGDLTAVSVSNPLSLNQWVHIVGTYRSGDSRIYANGVQIASRTDLTGTIDTGLGNNFIGKLGVGVSSYEFPGLIDDVRIYNRALAPDEIKRLYNMGATTKFNVSKKQDPSLNQGLVGLWTFDAPDMAGVAAYDRSGNNNTGTLTNGPTRQIGKIGQALNFAGVDDYVDGGSGSALDNSINSISLWIYPKAQNGGYLFSKKSWNCGYGLALSEFWQDTNDLDFKVTYNLDVSSLRVITSGANLVKNSWTHVVVSWDGTTNAQNVHIYKNGIEQSYGTRTTATGTRDDDSTYSAQIGACAGGNFNGPIDEVRVYNRALNPDEIKRLYNMGATTKFNVSKKQDPSLNQGLVGLWTFDAPDMAGVAAYDRSGNNNTGTLTNGPTPAIGRIGQALNFDGVDDDVTRTIANFRSGDSSGTVSAWVKGSDRVFSSTDIAGGNRYIILGTSGSNILLEKSSNDSIYHRTIATNNSFNSSQWNHLVWLSNGTSWNMYVNGVLQSLSSTNGDNDGDWFADISSRDNFFIGAYRKSDTSGFFTGLIDEVRVYNRALSPDEIKRLYNMGR